MWAHPDPHYFWKLDPDPDLHKSEKLDPDLHFNRNTEAFKQCCGSGSGIGAFLTPGSGIRNRFIQDPGSRIPDPKLIFLRA
jgi:hypothetical protein